MWYSASWQVLQEDVDDFTNCNADGTGGCSPTPNGTDRVYQQFWGLRYIDDTVMRRVDANADGDFSDAIDKVYFHLTDVHFSTVGGLCEVATVWPEDHAAIDSLRHLGAPQ